jgi:uncharacterized membrane protein
MKVSFRNNYNATVWVAIMRFDQKACANHGDWATAGWWKIEPGEEKWPFSTTNRFAYYYAEASDGAVWSGDYGPISVEKGAFESCLNITGNAGHRVGLLEIALPWFRQNPLATYTVNLAT